tara:strand:- start:207 stop:446 length:240 start_codon:yes stop_codon:yes gene_type:complete
MLAYTHRIEDSKAGTTYGMGHDAVDLYIYNTNTGEEKVVRDFTYFDLDSGSETYNMDLQIALDEQFNADYAETTQEAIN